VHSCPVRWGHDFVGCATEFNKAKFNKGKFNKAQNLRKVNLIKT
jgi:hypothetical protein